MKDIELVFETVQTNYGTRKNPMFGTNLDVFGCVIDGTSKRCTQLDRIRFDAEARKAGIPTQMKSILEKATAGGYGKDTCARLGYQYKDGKCVEKTVAPPKKTARTSAKRTRK